LAECLSYLEDVLSNGKPSVIIGDMNFPCAFNNEGFSQCHNVMSCYKVFHCDEFINSGNCITYCNHSLNQFSFLDYMFVSNSIRQDILHAEVHDTGVNLSDHIPVIYKFRWSLNCHKQLHNTHKVVKQYDAIAVLL